MLLNDMRPQVGSTRKARRIGRGMGSGVGKTGGRGYKGQKSRSGGYHKVGFEGGQMPLQRRLPKRGFRSTASPTIEVRLNELTQVSGNDIDLASLKAARVLPKWAKSAKIILSGEVTRAVTVRGIPATAGARKAIEAAGGGFADPEPENKGKSTES